MASRSASLFFVVVAKLRRLVHDPLMDTAISLVVPFAAYVVAEEIHASGVIAVVVAGLLLGHKAPIVQTAQSPHRGARSTGARSRSSSRTPCSCSSGCRPRCSSTTWAGHDLSPARIALVCALSLVGVIVLRLLWVFPARYLLVRPGADPDTGRRPPASYTFLLGWAGMRGVVTLAAAFVIPEDTPHREVLLLIAFTVVAGTLLIQGLTLPMLARRLEVPSPDPMDDALARATLLQQASKAGFRELKSLDDDDVHGVVALIKQRIEQRNFAAWERLGTTVDEETPSELYGRLRLAMIEAERERVLEIRSEGTTPSVVVAEVLAMLDVEESMLDLATQERAELRTVVGPPSRRGVRAPRGPPRRRDRDRRHLPVVRRRRPPLGRPAPVPRLRPRRLLRLLTRPARHRPLPRDRPRRHAVRRARRGLALVLRPPPHRLTPTSS